MNLGNRHSQHSFAQIPSVNTSRSMFDRSFAVKTTFNFDYLIPIFVEEILPGDTINLNVKTFCRLATQVVPLLDNMYIDYFFFFVPNRLVWENWERFNGAQDAPNSSTDYLIPQINAPTTTGFVAQSIYDQMGIPVGVDDISINALPLRAYNLIWNEWFRDQNLQFPVVKANLNGPDLAGDYTLLKRAKKHDYFTSALPWPQKGPSVSLPLGLSAPVYGHELNTLAGGQGHLYQAKNTGTNVVWAGQLGVNQGASNPLRTIYGTGLSDASNNNSYVSLADKSQYDLAPQARPPYADLTEATAATINQFRQAIMMQSILELDARGGTRYVEILKAHFNVISPDFRLQRPELLSVGTTKIAQHPVAQTSGSLTGDVDSQTPLATLAAFSTAAQFGNGIGFSKSFVEHGYVIGLCQARADVTYQQGLNKMWSRETRWDFFWPKFQELGEQAILNKEIYIQGTSADEEIFGYQERYAEYRYRPSEIRGQFRSSFAESLDVWHLAEEFGNLPALNGTFIQSNTPIERSLVVTEGYPDLLFDAWFDLKHARPMVTYGVPATLGRF